MNRDKRYTALVLFAVIVGLALLIAALTLTVYPDGTWQLGPFGGCALPSWGCIP